jgi:hypothetical protein
LSVKQRMGVLFCFNATCNFLLNSVLLINSLLSVKIWIDFSQYISLHYQYLLKLLFLLYWCEQLRTHLNGRCVRFV